MGVEVLIEQGAGSRAGFKDEDYNKFGAEVVPKVETSVLEEIDALLCVQLPQQETLKKVKEWLEI